MNGESEPTRERLMAMAYADGELDEAGRREFEALLANRPDLRGEVASHQRLVVLSRRMAGPEPMDHEWSRLASDPLHQAGMGGGLLLLLAAFVGLSSWGCWALCTSQSLHLGLKWLLGALLVGTVVLFLSTLRARLRTMPYDPYRDIER